VLLALCPFAQAQQPKKIARIGYLGAASYAANRARVEAFRQGLREAGYIEGQNIIIDYRYAEEKFDRIPALAAELVGLNVDVIVSGGSAATRPAREASATIPIVMTNDPDPVANGFVASLARPGGNITGLSTLSPEISGKRLEILREVVPKLSRVAVFGSSTEPNDAQSLREVELVAAALKMTLQYLDVRGSKDIETGFRAANKGRADALLVLSGAGFVAQRRRVTDLAAKNRLPAIYHRAEFVEDGGLMSYATSLIDLSRRAAIYVDKILKGAKPADLPVEQPKKFEFIINLKAAKQIALTIPPNVLARADRVIK
jgi:putative ABC transport system substrate-binding protein